MERYRRQAAVGAGGARVDALLAALRVLVVGAGGTGAPLLQLLARAGVGELRVIDPDTVSPTDLARQVLYHDDDAREGRPKVEAALEELRRIGGRTRLSGGALALHPRNAEALIEPFDLVFDATDHLPARHWIDAACRKLGRPWIHLAAIEASWTVIPFASAIGPCFRCYSPDPIPLSVLGSCETRGVLPPAPALAALHGISALYGWLQARARGEDPTAAEWTVIRRGEVGTAEVRTSRLERDPACGGCGPASEGAPDERSLRPICGRTRWEGWSERSLAAWRAALERDRTTRWTVEESEGRLRARGGLASLTVFSDGRFLIGPNENSASIRGVPPEACDRTPAEDAQGARRAELGRPEDRGRETEDWEARVRALLDLDPCFPPSGEARNS
ncbi:MAG: HesA/MoeB/ThiF family protein [Planctomycetota bacterium]|jgi:adenylyltransferase/sulfurtransferase